MTDRSFLQVTTDLLHAGYSVRFRATGRSMFPTIKDGEEITVEPVEPSSVRRGDILVFRDERGVTAHRLVRMRRTDRSRLSLVLRGDACEGSETIEPQAIMGRVISVDRPTGATRLAGARARFRYRCRRVLSGLGRCLRWVIGGRGHPAHEGSSN